MNWSCKQYGFSLVELLVALAISALVMTGVLRLATASVTGFKAQQTKSRLHEDARFAMDMLNADIRGAGFPPADVIPDKPSLAVLPDTAQLGSSDRLSLMRISHRNCFDHPNPVTGAEDQPLAWVLTSSYEVTPEGGLVRTCRYGAGAGEMVTQMNRMSIARSVRLFRIQLAQDQEWDGLAEQWVLAGAPGREQDIVAVRYQLHLSDGRRQETREATVGLRGRTGR